MNNFARAELITRSSPSNSIERYIKLFSTNIDPTSPCTPSSERRNNSDINSLLAFYDEKEKIMKTPEHYENIYFYANENINSIENKDESHEGEGDYFLSGKKRKRENTNSILETHKIKLNQVNGKEKNDIATRNKKDNKVNIKWVYKNKNNNPNDLNENDIIYDSGIELNSDDYINNNHQTFSQQLTLVKSMNEEENYEETEKSEIPTDVREEDKNKKKGEKAQKSVCIKIEQRIKYENVNPNKISQESDKDINMNSNTKLYPNKGKKISSKVSPGNLNIILDEDKIISNQKNSKQKENSNNSKKKKPNTKKIIFTTTTEKQKLYINNLANSKTKTKENQNKQLGIKKNGINTIDPKEYEISKDIREDNIIVTIKKKALGYFLDLINGEIKDEKLKLMELDPNEVGNINSKKNIDLINSKMKDVIKDIPGNNEKIEIEIGNNKKLLIIRSLLLNKHKISKLEKQLEKKLKKEYTKEDEKVRELLEKTFSNVLDDFKKSGEKWKIFEDDSRKEQEEFYTHKKFRNVIKDMPSNNLKNELEEIKEKYIYFGEPNAEGKKLGEGINTINPLEKFVYYHYKIKDEKGLESYIKKSVYKDLKFNYEDFTKEEKENINIYIDSLNNLAEAKNFLAFFKKRAHDNSSEENKN